MVEPYLEVDIAKGVAEFQGNLVEVAVAVLLHIESRAIVWESRVAVPFIIEDWLERCVAHLSTLRVDMETYWPEVAVHVDWWLEDPSEERPMGLRA